MSGLDSIIRVENVTYSYATDSEQPVAALRGIDLTIRRGEYLTIVGHNGSGKSTLARHLNALLLPDSGRVLVEDWDTSHPQHLRQIRSTVGMVFQNPDNQIVATIVEEDVAFGPENLGVAPHEIRSRVDEALELVGLDEFRLRAPHLLSGGQKQRVCIAGILALKPQVLVLDESTSMLDPAGRRQLLELAHRLNRKQGITVVTITHHMEEAVHADRLVVMSEGRIALEGSPREIFGQPHRLRQLQVDVPQITQLAHRVHRWNADFPADILNTAEFVEAVSQRIESPGPTLPAPSLEAPPRVEPPVGSEDSGAPSGVVIEVTDLEHDYLRGTPLQTRALDGLSMAVRQGEILGIIGATGSGKSTLVQHFNALLRPHGGQVLIFGLDSRQERFVKDIRRRVGFLFQQPEAQLFEHYVGDDVAYGPRNWNLSQQEVRDRVRRAMEAVGLGFEEYKDRLTFGLSGGQMRRAALAGVLALEPEALILDEPTAGLDPAGRRQLLDRLLELQSKYGTTLVLVSHDMEELARVCHRIGVVHRGRLAMLDRTAAVFSRTSQLSQMNLEPPDVTECLRQLRERSLIPAGPPALDLEAAELLLRELLPEGP